MNWQTGATAKDELLKACTILFGDDIDVSYDFLFYIQPSGLKSAYRRKAFETHPDANVPHHAEQDGGPGADLFIETNWAYNHLLDFIRHRDSVVRPFVAASNRSRPKKRPRRQAEEACGESRRSQVRGSYYRGEVPRRKLLFGQFLFYLGEVPWEALIKAIVWQRNQRPRLGEIAKRWGWASEDDIKNAMGQRQLGEHLGEALVRLNLINQAQLSSLLNKQQSMQHPFGEYFIQNSFITRARMHQLIREFKNHNNSHFRGFSTGSRF